MTRVRLPSTALIKLLGFLGALFFLTKDYLFSGVDPGFYGCDKSPPQNAKIAGRNFFTHFVFYRSFDAEEKWLPWAAFFLTKDYLFSGVEPGFYGYDKSPSQNAIIAGRNFFTHFVFYRSFDAEEKWLPWAAFFLTKDYLFSGVEPGFYGFDKSQPQNAKIAGRNFFVFGWIFFICKVFH